jgi:hypothetical protein
MQVTLFGRISCNQLLKRKPDGGPRLFFRHSPDGAVHCLFDNAAGT